MAISSPAAPITPTGALRVGLVATRRQYLGANLSSLAALTLIGLMVAGWMSDTLWLYSESTPLGEQGHTLGPVFTVLAVLLLVVSPGRVAPRRVDGSLMRALAAGPEFRRRVHTELHGAEVYKARRYLPSVVALAVLWIAGVAAYYLSMREVWADPDVTMHTGAKWAVVVLAVGVLGVLLMLPGRSRRTVLVDDEGRFFTDPGSPQAPVEPARPAAPAPAAGFGRGRIAIVAVLSVLATVLALVAAVGYFATRGGEARSPSEVADLFGQARVKCLDFDVITISTATKTLGCRTDDAQIITVTTYGDLPTSDAWLADRCEVSQGATARLRRGYYLVGEDFILDMHQLRHPKFVTVTAMNRTATRLARVLDAAAIPYNCNAR